MQTDQPQDRIHRKKKKPPRRVVRMKLDIELADALVNMARGNVLRGTFIPAPRKFHDMIDCALRYAVWKHSQGDGPDAEFARVPNGYEAWNENLRVKRPQSQRASILRMPGMLPDV